MEQPRSAPQPYLGLVLEKLRRVSPGEVGLPGPGCGSRRGRKRQTSALGSERRRGRSRSRCPSAAGSACVRGRSRGRGMLGPPFVWRREPGGEDGEESVCLAGLGTGVFSVSRFLTNDAFCPGIYLEQESVTRSSPDCKKLDGGSETSSF